MPNLFKQFLDLIPDPALQVGTVTAVDVGGVTVTLPDGGVLSVRGTATIGQSVFIRGGVIEGEAPSIPVELIEV